MFKQMTFIEKLISVTIVLMVIGMCFQPYFESRTYNKLTGAHTTYWDAVWVELRVIDLPLKK